MRKDKLNMKVYTNSNLILKFLLVSSSIFYCYLATLPKHSDFWSLNYITRIFAAGKFDVYAEFIARTGQANAPLTMHPPAFYILQSYWLRLGSYIFKYDLIDYNLLDPSSYPYFYQLWGMITYLIALFALVLISYYSLRNKWLCLLCFGPFTFISLSIMGQTDIFCALLIYISLILALKSFESEKYMFYSTILLGVSATFKTYGAMLYPAYLLYFFLVLRIKKENFKSIYGTSVLLIFVFAFCSLFIWLPYAQWFKDIMIAGESNYLFFLQLNPSGAPPFHNLALWLLGYMIILYDLLYNILNNPNKVYENKKYFLFYVFTIISWFFIAVFTHPQWWVLLLPPLLLVLDNFDSELNHLFSMSIQTIFLLYPMLFINNIDNILKNYIPVIVIPNKFALVLSTITIAILVLWIIDLKRELNNNFGSRNENKSILSQVGSVLPVALILILMISNTIMIYGTDNNDINCIKLAQEAADMPIGEINENTIVGQTFFSPYKNLSSIEILLATYARINANEIIFYLRDRSSSEDIVSVKVSAKNITDNSYCKFSFPVIRNSENKLYYFSIESPKSTPGNAITIWVSSRDPYKKGSAYKNGQKLNNIDLAFRACYDNK